MRIRCNRRILSLYNYTTMIRTRIIAAFLVIASFLLGFFVFSANLGGGATRFPFKLGLDLSGGIHLVYKADVSGIAQQEVDASMDALRNTIERRINILGVSEPLVQVEKGGLLSGEATHKLVVELPGETNVERAVKAIGATPSLEFMLLKKADIEKIQAMSGDDALKQMEVLKAFKQTGLTGRLLEKAQLVFTQTTREPSVHIMFNSEGRELFAKVTRENIGDTLAIFLDGQPISMPVIRQEIRDGSAEISGSFSVETARDLVRDLNYGALPVPVELMSTQTIGASLGDRALEGSIMAGIWAYIIVSLFLIAWYRVPGIISALALAVYALINLAAFKLIPVTLTAAGIAGFVLSMGMAVDANILIFERLKEELARGRGIRDAMQLGFSRAWLSIRDSNTSSIITGLILFMFSSSSLVSGFALVFIIGVLASMFTALTLSRILLRAITPESNGKVAQFLFSNGFGHKIK